MEINVFSVACDTGVTSVVGSNHTTYAGGAPVPSPRVVSESDVVNTFDNLEVELCRFICRQLRGSTGQDEGMSIAMEIVTLVRCRWDNAPSLYHWWAQMDGESFSTVGLNRLYQRLQDLGVDVARVLHVIARTYGWLTSGLLIVDDTSVQKYGVWMQGVSKVRVANVQGSVMGHNIVTLMLANCNGAIFLKYEVKVNPAKPRLARHRGRPIDEVRAAQRRKKWEMALDLIREARARGVDASWVVFDCAYFNAGSEVPRRLTADGIWFVSKAKSNDTFLVHGIKLRAKDFQDLPIT